jgi:FMN phosphatase YigB (HAD superfamily)
MKDLYIFDLDGTLALIEHRRHFVECKRKNWPRFFAACVDDTPNEAVIETLRRLQQTGAEIWIWSGRSDEVRAQTEAWLKTHHIHGRLQMRKSRDYRPDDILKAEWIDSMTLEERSRLIAIFDDRDRVVAMWRAKGVTCFQVAPGNF